MTQFTLQGKAKQLTISAVMLQTAGCRKWHTQYWTPPREFQRRTELTRSFNELFVFCGPHHSLAVHIFLRRPDNDFLLLMFSCFKPLMADSLSPTLGTVSHHLLPRSLSVRPVAAPRSTLQHITRHGPKQGCTSGVAAGHQPQVLRSTLQRTVTPTAGATARRKVLCGQKSKKGYAEHGKNIISAARGLVCLKALHVSRKNNSDNQHILMSVKALRR